MDTAELESRFKKIENNLQELKEMFRIAITEIEKLKDGRKNA